MRKKVICGYGTLSYPINGITALKEAFNSGSLITIKNDNGRDIVFVNRSKKEVFLSINNGIGYVKHRINSGAVYIDGLMLPFIDNLSYFIGDAYYKLMGNIISMDLFITI